jgi:hypothetical protein
MPFNVNDIIAGIDSVLRGARRGQAAFLGG